jgi:hypothetical protein
MDRVRNLREQVIREAKERCARLQSAIAKCEEYESTLSNFHSWCSHMHQILNARLADDFAALDIPQEYKVRFIASTPSIVSLPLLNSLE